MARIEELEALLVPNEEERICNRCGEDYTAGGDGCRDEHSAFCDRCAQDFCGTEALALLAVAREHAQLLSQLEHLTEVGCVGGLPPNLNAIDSAAIATGWSPTGKAE